MPKELRGVAVFVASLWIIRAIDSILSIDLNQFGVLPRTLHGLIGVVCMPFLHGGWGHLMSNTLPLCVLLFMLVSTRKDYWEIIASIVVFGGLFLWCFGRPDIHVGASGLIFGLIGFLITIGFTERKPVSILVSIIVGFLYGTTLLFGVLPVFKSHVSWEGHLFGAIAGAMTAYFMPTSQTASHRDENGTEPPAPPTPQI